jgi:hypothetical protein
LYRRIGVPAVLGALLTVTYTIPLIDAIVCSLAAFGVLSMGYGLPDKDDAGSILGRFWLSLTKVYEIADALTRATVGFLFSLCFFPCVFDNAIFFFVALFITTLGFPIIEEEL